MVRPKVYGLWEKTTDTPEEKEYKKDLRNIMVINVDLNENELYVFVEKYRRTLEYQKVVENPVNKARKIMKRESHGE